MGDSGIFSSEMLHPISLTVQPRSRGNDDLGENFRRWPSPVGYSGFIKPINL